MTSERTPADPPAPKTPEGEGGRRPPARRSSRRLREAAIGLTLSAASLVAVVLLAEVAFRLRGSPEPGRWYVRAVRDGREVVENVRYEPTRRLPLRVAPSRFLPDKPDGTVRVFCVGDSTVFGYPYAPRGTPSRLLSAILDASVPAGRFEVINSGFLGADSSRVLGLIRELAAYGPDAFVVYVGHNEFLRYDEAHQHDVRFRFHPDLALSARARMFVAVHESALWRWACGTDLGLSARGWWHRLRTGQRIGRSGRIEGELKELTFRSYEANLREMAGECARLGVALVLSVPAGNSRSQAPLFRIRSRPPGDPASRAVDERLERAGEEIAAGRPEAALELLAEAAGLDPRDALVDFLEGRARVALGRTEAARDAFESAIRKDGLRHRSFSRIADIARAVGRDEPAAVLSDVRAAFEEGSPFGIVGEELLVDHVHPNLTGQVRLARLWARSLADAGLVPLPPIEGLPLTDDDLIGRLGLGLADRRDAMLRRAVSSVGQVNPVRAAALFRIAATLYEPGEAEAALGPVYLRGVAALVQGDEDEARRLLERVRQADPDLYRRMNDRFAQLRIEERLR